MLDDANLAKDTLAIVDRAGTRIQFVVSDPDTLTSDTYEVLMWDVDYMLIGMSSKYLDKEFHAQVTSKIADELEGLADTDEVSVPEHVKNRSVTLLKGLLEQIIDDLIMAEDIPEETTNVELLISRLLSED
jgi:hypothetical protein